MYLVLDSFGLDFLYLYFRDCLIIVLIMSIIVPSNHTRIGAWVNSKM